MDRHPAGRLGTRALDQRRGRIIDRVKQMKRLGRPVGRLG